MAALPRLSFKGVEVIVLLKKWLRVFGQWCLKKSLPTRDVLVMNLIMRIAGMGLMGKKVYLNFLPGMIGPVCVEGTSNPIMTYKMFEKTIMEFINIKVYLSRPDRIEFVCTIEGTDPKTHGQILENDLKYTTPFYDLAFHLYSYWPIYRQPALTSGPRMEHDEESVFEKTEASLCS